MIHVIIFFSMKKIIYDLGASKGENIPYYLLRSDLIIAVEANIESCEIIKKKFYDEINQKKLIVENCIVSELDNVEDYFYVNKSDHLLSQFPKPDNDMISKFKKISVLKKDIWSLINKYGPAYYIKIDLEEYDNVILKRIFELGINPNYISAEAINLEVIKLFLNNKNYNSFKINEGKNIEYLYNKVKLDLNTGKIKYSFPKNSAGPFGNDIIGKWINKKNFVELMEFKQPGWRDIHASLIDKSENINKFNNYINFKKKLEKKARLLKRIQRLKSKFNFFKND